MLAAFLISLSLQEHARQTKIRLNFQKHSVQFKRQFILDSNVHCSNQEYDTRLICMNNGSNKDLKHGKNNVDKSKTACIKNKNSVTSPVEGRELSYLSIWIDSRQ